MKCLRCLCLAAMIPFGLLFIVDGEALSQKVDKKKRDANIANYVKQLQSRFASWDTNADNVLDKNELAKAFRGADAKPYDATVDVKGPKTPDLPSTKLNMVFAIDFTYAMVAANEVPGSHGLAVLLVDGPAHLLASVPNKAPAANFTAYADYQFIVLAGTKSQDQLTKPEFDAWAKTYAKLIQDRNEAAQAVKASQDKFTKAKTVAQKQTAQADLTRHVQDQQALNAQWILIPPAIHQTLNVK